MSRSSRIAAVKPALAPGTGEPTGIAAGSRESSGQQSGPRVFGAVTAGHFAIDVFNSMGPVLLAFLKAPLALSAGQVGFAVGLYQFLAGSTQPLFGWVADRRGSRWLGPASVLCAILGVSGSVWVAGRTGSFAAFLLLFAVAAVGSGAFHPQGTMHAGRAIAGRAATTTAVFFFCGQAGLASGPALAGLALDNLGPPGIYALALILSLVPVYMAVAMAGSAPRRTIGSPPPEPILLGRLEPFVVGLFATVFGLRAWIFIGTASFLPLLFQGFGWSSTGQGFVSGLFWLGGGLGGVLAGNVADRLGRRRVVFGTTFLGALLLLLLPGETGPFAFVLAALCGGLLGAPHSILMVMSQDLLPVRRGLASGLSLGYLFAMGAVGSWGIGLLADRFGLAPVLRSGALLGLVAALLCLLLPATRQVD